MNSPYTTQEKVAYFRRNLLLKQPQFTKDTAIPEEVIDQQIVWVSAAIDLRFHSAGFIIPFVALDGESWQTYQTTYLEYLCTLGVVALTTPTIQPQVSTREPAMTTLERMYRDELQKIYDGKYHHLRFRAKYYINTPAERALTLPIGPLTDYENGTSDKFKFYDLDQFTEFYERVRCELDIPSQTYDEVIANFV